MVYCITYVQHVIHGGSYKDQLVEDICVYLWLRARYLLVQFGYCK